VEANNVETMPDSPPTTTSKPLVNKSSPIGDLLTQLTLLGQVAHLSPLSVIRKVSIATSTLEGE
jgi:hypothetical protein